MTHFCKCSHKIGNVGSMKKKSGKNVNAVRFVKSTNDMPKKGGVFILSAPPEKNKRIDSTLKSTKNTPSKR